MATKLDPWGAVSIDDYSKLFEEFGISSFEDLLPQIDDPHAYMKRHIIFGHRDYHRAGEAMKEKNPFAVMWGVLPMPAGALRRERLNISECILFSS